MGGSFCPVQTLSSTGCRPARSGVVFPSRASDLKNFSPIPLLVILLGSSALFAAPQTTPQAPTARSPLSQHPKRPKVDRKALLARARRGDGGSQMWLGAGYEQG